MVICIVTTVQVLKFVLTVKQWLANCLSYSPTIGGRVTVCVMNHCNSRLQHRNMFIWLQCCQWIM